MITNILFILYIFEIYIVGESCIFSFYREAVIYLLLIYNKICVIMCIFFRHGIDTFVRPCVYFLVSNFYLFLLDAVSAFACICVTISCQAMRCPQPLHFHFCQQLSVFFSLALCLRFVMQTVCFVRPSVCILY